MIFFIKILLSGMMILLVALLLNMTAAYFGINTWYHFVERAGEQGIIDALKNENIGHMVFLFLVYPFLLGATGYFGRIIFGKY